MHTHTHTHTHTPPAARQSVDLTFMGRCQPPVAYGQFGTQYLAQSCACLLKLYFFHAV